LNKSFSRLIKASGLPHIRFHDLRHSAASILLAKGVNPKVVQELPGHSSIKMTMDIYSHLIPPLRSTVKDLMNDAFEERGQESMPDYEENE
jgi:integrase